MTKPDQVNQDTGQPSAIPETVEYGGVRCRVIRSDTPNIVTIRHPGPPPRALRIVVPFGEPGKTLFIDGIQYSVCECRSLPMSGLVGTRLAPEDSAPPLFNSYILVKVRHLNGALFRLEIHSVDGNAAIPVAIAHKSGAMHPVPAGGLAAAYGEVLSGSEIECNAQALFAEPIGATDCFVIAEPIVAVGDLPLNLPPIADTMERTFGSLTVIGDFAQVRFKDNEYDIRRGSQTQAVLRFLCERGATRADRAILKTDIEDHLRGQGILPKNRQSWRPSQIWGRRLKGLSEVLVCCDKLAGKYHIS